MEDLFYGVLIYCAPAMAIAVVIYAVYFLTTPPELR